MHGIAWTGGMKWFVQIVTWGATVLIARILSPGDFGLLGMATLYLGFVQLVNEFGLGAAIIQQKHLTREQISALGGLSALMGFALWGVSALLAIPVASFFREPAVRWIITVLGITFVITGFEVLPRSLMARDLQFRRIAIADTVDALVNNGATLILAILGLRYWSLVLGGIIGAASGCLLALYWRRHRLSLPRSLASISGAVRLGWHIVVSRISWYLYGNADFTVVGRLLDKVALGAYSIGWKLASLPVERISALVGQVTPAVFSAVQHDQAALRRYLLRLTEGLALLTFPMAAGIALVSRDFVLGVLGAKWSAAIVPLQILACYAGLRSITTIFAQILNYTGRSRQQMYFSLLALVVLPPLFVLGARLDGITGVAWGWVVGYPLVMLPGFLLVLRVTGLSVGGYLSAVRLPILGSAAMSLVVLATRYLLPAGWPAIARLALLALAGATTYGLLVYSSQAERIRNIYGMLRRRTA